MTLVEVLIPLICNAIVTDVDAEFHSGMSLATAES
jgi:hypothetical protein